MRRSTLSALGALATGILILGAASPATAAPPTRSATWINAHEVFAGGPNLFESNIPGCESGEVVNGAGGAHFTPRGGSFAGIKEFTCEGGEAGFTVLLTARFGEGGSSGHWTLKSTWGELESITGGSGSLVGTPTDLGIDDHYTGYLR
jgi:hypothetical protein